MLPKMRPVIALTLEVLPAGGAHLVAPVVLGLLLVLDLDAVPVVILDVFQGRFLPADGTLDRADLLVVLGRVNHELPCKVSPGTQFNRK